MLQFRALAAVNNFGEEDNDDKDNEEEASDNSDKVD